MRVTELVAALSRLHPDTTVVTATDAEGELAAAGLPVGERIDAALDLLGIPR